MINKNKRIAQAEFIKWFGPILDVLRDLGGSGKPKEVSQKIAEKFKIPAHVLEETVKSGAFKFHNQVAWARQYLVWERLLDSSRHGIWTLTWKGNQTKLSDEQSSEIFSKWVEYHQEARRDKSEDEIIEEQEENKPEIIQESYNPDLLNILQKLTPQGFEQICGLLLRESGFENVTVTGRSHDDGIDGFGTLEINPFVSMKVLFQCKRYKGTISRAQVGDFRNAMLGRAEKGIILTTGTFSPEALKEANREGVPKIELIDGEKLVELFKKVELGMNPKTVYEIDLAFFDQYIDKKLI